MAGDDRSQELPHFAFSSHLTGYMVPGRSPDVAVKASVRFSDATLRCVFELTGAILDIVLPEAGEVRRTDELWQATCFELFLQDHPGPAYQEFNISPAHGWNIYQFDTYRQGMRPVPTRRAPKIHSRRGHDDFLLSFEIAETDFLRRPDFLHHPGRVNLTTILLDRSGDLHYYALDVSHTPPDFHNPDSFAPLA